MKNVSNYKSPVISSVTIHSSHLFRQQLLIEAANCAVERAADRLINRCVTEQFSCKNTSSKTRSAQHFSFSYTKKNRTESTNNHISSNIDTLHWEGFLIGNVTPCNSLQDLPTTHGVSPMPSKLPSLFGSTCSKLFEKSACPV